MRVLEPEEGILAFYDGREAGVRYAAGSNWVDDGAISLGIASYAIVDGDEALIYDTHVSVRHAQEIRAVLEARGVRHMRVLLSHWHLDHIAGTEAFADCEILAGERTAALLHAHREAIEAGTHDGPPAIRPLVRPTTTLSGPTALRVGPLELELLPANIHSDDATLVWFPERRLLLAGDALEDPITYVAEPQHLADHLVDLARLSALEPARILPNHGDAAVIEGGGYGPGLIDATALYVRALLAIRADPALAAMPLQELLAGPLRDGSITWFSPYERVHVENVAAVLGATGAR